MQNAPESVHDWTLSGIDVDWAGATATIRFLDRASSPVVLLASGLRRLVVNRDLPWGASVSVQELVGPVALADEAVSLDLCIQSGDWVRVEAQCFAWSRSAPAAAANGGNAADGSNGLPILGSKRSGVRNLMSAQTFANVFSDRAQSDFPFRDRRWIAVAFERNAYGCARMPEWFFRAASKRFGDGGRVELLVAGDGFAAAGLTEVCAVPFAWEDYREFMARPQAYSLEYRMTGSDATFGCVADADITVFAGEAARMEALLADVGGAGRMLEHMRQEFLLGDADGYPDMDRFFQRLLFPSKRACSGVGA